MVLLQCKHKLTKPALSPGRGKIIHQVILTLFLAAALAVLLGPLQSRKARAASCCPSAPFCTIAENAISQALETALHEVLREHITQEFIYQQRWFMFDFFRDFVLPGLMQMTEQLSTVGEAQVFTFGAIMDAKESLETQRLFHEKMAQAQRDYHPDVGMCTIGTAAESLAASDRTAETMANALTKRMIDRQLGLQYSSGSEGITSDVKSRVEQLRRRFCDRHSSGGNTTNLCLAAAAGPHINKDIDYAGTVGLRRTINMNLTNNSLAAPDTDDENIMALASNLYGNRIFERTPTPNTPMDGANAWISGQMSWYLDKRAVTAKRSVAQNSFNAIVGMKAAGSAASENAGNYLYAIFSQLGVTDDAEARQLLGANPSYYALLEAISQKVYQNPTFFVNLYDSPTNVMRKNVAMQAVNLMLDRDTFKSEMRTEALLSVLLETEMIRYQRDLSNRLNQMTDQAAPLP